MNKWMIGRCLQQGLSHINEGKVCQDHMEYDTNDAQTCIAAVLADGLGSRVYSELASRAATKAIVKWLLENSDWLCDAPDVVEVIQNQLLDRAKSAILDTARERMLNVEDLDCNLAFLCVQIPQKKAICGHLGDCAVCILDGKPRVLTAQNGSAIGTNTVMTARPDEIRVEVLDINEQVNGFILTSDGLDGEIYRKNSTFVRNVAKDYFNTVFAAEPDAALMQKVLDLQNSKGSEFDDDISIVVVSQAKAPIDLPQDPRWLCKCKTRNPLTSSYCTNCHADFLSLYPHSFINRFDGLDQAILHLNEHPQEELAVLGLPPVPVQKPAVKAKKPEKEKSKGSDKKTEPSGDSRPAWVKKPDGNTQTAAPEEQRGAGRPGLPGGSSAFVQQQAQQQHEESRVRAAEREAFNDEGRMNPYKSDPGNGPKQSRASGIDRFLNRWELPLLCLAAVAIIVFLVLGRFMPSSGKDPSKESTGPAVQQTEPEDNRTRDTRPTVPQTLDNYVGEERNGVPNGPGVLYEGGCFWVGTFVNGVKDGVFQKISADDTSRVEQVEFDMGREIRFTEPTETTEPPAVQSPGNYELIGEIGRLYPDNTLTVPEFVELQVGEIVMADEARSFEADGVKWIWIESSEGEGYCDASCLMPLKEADQ